ncbi:MFS transporter [Alcaligenes parafaecalis]|nr:MFS transporter [Alcaligenes parafaecalis]
MTLQENALVTPRIVQARMATFGGFALIGAMMYIWSTSVSALRYHLGLTGAQGDLSFGMIAFSIGVGAAVGSLLVGRFIDVLGPKRAVGTTLILYPLSIIPLGLVSDLGFAQAFGLVFGLLRGATDTALNAHGVQVERFYGRPIMAGFHAFYSLGGLLFGLLGSYFAGQYTESAAVPFILCAGCLLIASMVIFHYLLNKEELSLAPGSEDQAAFETNSPESPPKAGGGEYIILLMVGFGLLLLGAMLGENAVADWGQEYLSRHVGTSTATAAMAISFFTGAQFLGRIAGDYLARLLGQARLVMGCGLCAVLGLLVVVFGDSAFMGIIGFTLFGLGLSCIAPMMLSSAGRKDPANAGRNIGIVNGIGFTGMLAAPALLSLVVNTFGIGKLLYIPLMLLGILAIFGPRLMQKRMPESSI